MSLTAEKLPALGCASDRPAAEDNAGGETSGASPQAEPSPTSPTSPGRSDDGAAESEEEEYADDFDAVKKEKKDKKDKRDKKERKERRERKRQAELETAEQAASAATPAEDGEPATERNNAETPTGQPKATAPSDKKTTRDEGAAEKSTNDDEAQPSTPTNSAPAAATANSAADDGEMPRNAAPPVSAEHGSTTGEANATSSPTGDGATQQDEQCEREDNAEPSSTAEKPTSSAEKHAAEPREDTSCNDSKAPPQSAAEAEVQAGQVTHRTAVSVGATSAARPKVRNLENIDTRQSTGNLLTSPRSLLACAREGIDPNVDFRDIPLSIFISRAKNHDRDVAQTMFDAWKARRDGMLADAKDRRNVMIRDEAAKAEKEQKKLEKKQSSIARRRRREEASAEAFNNPSVRSGDVNEASTVSPPQALRRASSDAAADASVNNGSMGSVRANGHEAKGWDSAMNNTADQNSEHPTPPISDAGKSGTGSAAAEAPAQPRSRPPIVTKLSPSALESNAATSTEGGYTVDQSELSTRSDSEYYDEEDEETDDDESPGARRRRSKGPPGIMSPRSFALQREKARAKQVERRLKLERRATQNLELAAKRREDVVAVQRKQTIEQERRRREQEEKDIILQAMRERAAKRRDAEMQVRRIEQEQLVRDRFERLTAEREARDRAQAQKDALRAAEEEAQREARAKKLEEQRYHQEQRLLAVKVSAERKQQERREVADALMRAADLQRERVNEQRAAALAQQKAINQKRTNDHAEKRAKAAEFDESRVQDLRTKQQMADERRELEEAKKHDRWLARQEKENERLEKRRRRLELVRQEEQRRTEGLAHGIEHREKRHNELEEERQREAALRAAQKEAVVEDRVAHARRVARMVEYQRQELGMKSDAKLARVEKIRQEAKAMELRRLNIVSAAAAHRNDDRGPIISDTPGPAAYSAEAVASKLFTSSPAVKIGQPSVLAAVPRDTGPGPGQYSDPRSAIRPRGPKLPPRPASMMLVSIDHGKGKPTKSKSSDSSGSLKAKRALSCEPSVSLPPVGKQGLGLAKSSGIERPDVVIDADFLTDDEFEDAV